MCLIGLAWKVHAKYKLIMVANRDELYNRPTQPAHFWKDHPNVLAGKDLQAGGTWLGVEKKGNFTVITNYKDIKNHKRNALSRGFLTLNYLVSRLNPFNYLQEIESSLKMYNGCNLLLGNKEDLYYCSNIVKCTFPIKAGIYGLSNHFLNTPWYKVKKVKKKLKIHIQDNRLENEDLFEMMYDKTFAPNRRSSEDTPINEDPRKLLSAMFIHSLDYGTVNTTILKIDYKNRVFFEERNYNSHSKYSEISNHYFSFQIEK